MHCAGHHCTPLAHRARDDGPRASRSSPSTRPCGCSRSECTPRATPYCDQPCVASTATHDAPSIVRRLTHAHHLAWRSSSAGARMRARRTIAGDLRRQCGHRRRRRWVRPSCVTEPASPIRLEVCTWISALREAARTSRMRGASLRNCDGDHAIALGNHLVDLLLGSPKPGGFRSAGVVKRDDDVAGRDWYLSTSDAISSTCTRAPGRLISFWTPPTYVTRACFVRISGSEKTAQFVSATDFDRRSARSSRR